MLHLPPPSTRTRAFTLTELIVVLLVLVAVAAIVVPTVGGYGEDSKQAATEASLVRIREAILGDASGTGYVENMDGVLLGEPAVRSLKLRDLFSPPVGSTPYDPNTRRGWNGPYLRHLVGRYQITDLVEGDGLGSEFTATYGAQDDPCVLDGWGNPIVIQRPNTASATEDDRDRYVRLVSAGLNGKIDSSREDLMPSDLEDSRDDDVVLFLFVAGA